MKQKIFISLFVGSAISGVALYFAFRNVPFDDLLEYLSSINYAWVFPAAVLVLVSFAIRTVRWQIILESIHRIGFWHAFHPLMMGFMINCILPGRVGEMVRPALLQKRDRIPFSSGLATIAAERIFDIILLMALFAVVMAFVKIDPNLSIPFGSYRLNRETLVAINAQMVKVIIVLVAGIALVSFTRTRLFITRLILNLPVLFFSAGAAFREKVREKVCRPVIRIIENLASGFSLVRRPGRVFACFALSFFVWVLLAVSMAILAIGCPGIDLTFFELTAVMIIVCFFIALPSAPGFWGLWEAGGVFAMALFGMAKQEAAGFTLANHAVQMFPVILVGLVSAAITGVNIWEVVRERRTQDSGKHPETAKNGLFR
jgi:uncharacterized protein (TIRG00374 family)